MNPNIPMHGLHKLHKKSDYVRYIDMDIANGVAVFADGDHDHTQYTQHAICSRSIIFLGVAIDWKVE
jgi:hypothetical protein